MKNIYRTLAVLLIANLIIAILCLIQAIAGRSEQILGFILALYAIEFIIQKIFNLISKMLENNNELDEAKIFID